MKVTIRYFASVREAVGTSLDTVELPPNSNLENLFTHLRDLRPRLWNLVLEDRKDGMGRRLVLLLDGMRVDALDTEIRDGSQLVIMPPVAGG